jgi:hypothetical protein
MAQIFHPHPPRPDLPETTELTALTQRRQVRAQSIRSTLYACALNLSLLSLLSGFARAGEPEHVAGASYFPSQKCRF